MYDAHQTALKADELIVFPEVANAILKLVDDDQCGLEQIGQLVKQDLALSSALLRLTNSAKFTGAGGAVDDIESALVRVGTRELVDLVYGICIPRATSDLENKISAINDFWKHSLSTAVLAKRIAADIPRVSEQTAFTGGLIHDVGRLVLFHQYPEESTTVAMKIMIEDYESREAEQEVFGLTHEEVGSELCKIWGFSEKLTGCVSCHHTTTLDPQLDRLTIVIHIADKLSETFETGDDPIPVFESLEPAYRDTIFKEDVDLNTIFAEAEEEFKGMSSYIIN